MSTIQSARPAHHPNPASTDARARYRRHVGWIDRHLGGFADSGPDERAAHVVRLQRHGELALAYRARRLVEQSAGDEESMHAWRAVLLANLDDPIVRERSRSELSSAHARLMPYVVLRSLGEHRDPWHDATLAAAERAGFPLAAETVPYRRADQLFFQLLAETEDGPRASGLRDSLERAIDDTVLARIRAPFHLDRDAMYSVTHTILYATSFGVRPLDTEWRHAQRARDVIEMSLVAAARAGDWDLLGELLLCGELLPGVDPGLRAAAERLFLGAERPDGAVIASRASAHALEEAGGEELDPFDACYHTTLVALFLAAAQLRRAGADPALPPPPRAAAIERKGCAAGLAGARAFLRGHDARLLAGEEPAPAGEEPAPAGAFDEDAILTASREDLDRILAAPGHARLTPAALAALGGALAASKDYAGVIRVLGRSIEQGAWTAASRTLFGFLLEAQLPDGRLGLIGEELAALGSVSRLAVYGALTARFALLCERLLREPRTAGDG